MPTLCGAILAPLFSRSFTHVPGMLDWQFGPCRAEAYLRICCPCGQMSAAVSGQMARPLLLFLHHANVRWLDPWQGSVIDRQTFECGWQSSKTAMLCVPLWLTAAVAVLSCMDWFGFSNIRASQTFTAMHRPVKVSQRSTVKFCLRLPVRFLFP